jgi:DNA mismatch repair protein MutS
VFLHAVKPGPASRSYGLQVARLAGVPRDVLAAARTYLAQLEKRDHELHPPGPQAELIFAAPVAAAGVPPAGSASLPDGAASAGVDAGAAASAARAVHGELVSLDPDELTPREALDALYRLKSLLEPPA